MKTINYLILVLLMVSPVEYYFTSESNLDYGPCTPSNDRAKRAVEFFLDASHLQDFRVETGTTNLQKSQIQHVSDIATCQRLRDLVNSNTDLQNSDLDRTMYFYRAGNFYFIFYDYKKIRTGYTDFNVISSDFRVLGMYLI